MIERADQLVLEYVSKVADAAHGVLRPEQRLDFVRRLRARIEQERRGSDDPVKVRKVIARFGDPAELLRRELRRLAEEGRPVPAPGVRTPPRTPFGPVTRRPAASPPSGVRPRPAGPLPGAGPRASAGGNRAWRSAGPAPPDEFGDSATEVMPAITGDDPPTAAGPPVRPGTGGPAPGAGDPGAGAARPGAGAGRPGAGGPGGRSAPAGGPAGRPWRVPPVAAGHDLARVLRGRRREMLGLALLALAAALIPFPLPYVAIFPVPLLVWALASVVVLSCGGWSYAGRVSAVLAPVVAYAAGGAALGVVRAPDAPGTGLTAFANAYFDVSGTMFVLGTVAGVLWLGYRLVSPPPPPPRRRTPGSAR
ncbi:hypothetical protein Sru01_45880 [Sphaerisporangium rufum]|uniref:Uncharacterized protein n=1 Tax=Sphaerisporangium rufum TaxID=1381558 RepID=A0A919R725_9ACTN|nr:hypothetical protein [Sphaerisporangium rufum]GII79606.1 hypothetical protein Sru01_45880 [Sphaerisporangium rufum]